MVKRFSGPAVIETDDDGNNPVAIFTGPDKREIRSDDADYAAAVVGAAAMSMTAALFGDSYSARNTTVGSNCRDLDWGYFSWAQALIGAPWQLIYNGGVSGNTTTQMLARQSDALALYRPGWWFVQGGINDIIAGASVPAVVANLQSIIARFVLSGARVVFLSLAPNAQAAGYSLKVQQINQAMREWCMRTSGNAIYIDTYSALVNPTSTTGAFASGMSDDNLHLSAKGARAAGQAIANALSPILPMRNFLPSSAAESYGVDNGSKQLLDNPLMASGASAPTGTGASGTLPTSWLGSVGGSVSSAVYSQVARADGIGQDCQIAVTGAASGASVNIRQSSLAGRAAIGDTLYTCGEISISGATDVRGVNIGAAVTIDGVTQQINVLEISGSTNYDSTAFTIRARSNDLLLSGASITSILYNMTVTFGTSGSGAATIKLGRAGFYKR